MTRLIDEEETFRVLSEYYKHRYYEQDKALLDALSRVPTVEAVPVIRCKDCRKFKGEFCAMYNEEKNIHRNESNDFCSWAERKGRQ